MIKKNNKFDNFFLRKLFLSTKIIFSPIIRNFFTIFHLFSYDLQLKSKTDIAISSRLIAMLVRNNWDNGQYLLSTYSNVRVHVRKSVRIGI